MSRREWFGRELNGKRGKTKGSIYEESRYGK